MDEPNSVYYWEVTINLGKFYLFFLQLFFHTRAGKLQYRNGS